MSRPIGKKYQLFVFSNQSSVNRVSTKMTDPHTSRPLAHAIIGIQISKTRLTFSWKVSPKSVSNSMKPSVTSTWYPRGELNFTITVWHVPTPILVLLWCSTVIVTNIKRNILDFNLVQSCRNVGKRHCLALSFGCNIIFELVMWRCNFKWLWLFFRILLWHVSVFSMVWRALLV